CHLYLRSHRNETSKDRKQMKQKLTREKHGNRSFARQKSQDPMDHGKGQPVRKKAKQLRLLKRQESDYGGELLKKREGRAHGRPLSTTNTMHLVLRSSR